jgi:ABC-2 type transport system permease protein
MIISWLEPYRYLSPFHYYADNDPINNGLDSFDSLVLIVLTVISLAGAVFAFTRRDVQV